MSEKHRKRKYYHHHKRRRMKKRVFYMLLTTLFCVALATLISTGTANVYAVTGKVTLYVVAAAFSVIIVFLVLYQMTIGRRH
jgi:hypothetical protein